MSREQTSFTGGGRLTLLKTDRETYIVIGKWLNPEIAPELQGRVAPDEFAVEVSAGDLIEALRNAAAKPAG